MKDLLKKLKLNDHFSTSIEIEKTAFVAKLKKHVDPGSFGMFSDMSDIFSSSKNIYKGEVRSDSFKIKRRKKFFDTNQNLAFAEGTLRQEGSELIIDTEITGFKKMIIVFFAFLIIFYTIFISMFFLFDTINESPTFILPFIILHGIFMVSIPFFIIRRSVKQLKHELEREFFYIAKK